MHFTRPGEISYLKISRLLCQGRTAYFLCISTTTAIIPVIIATKAINSLHVTYIIPPLSEQARSGWSTSPGYPGKYIIRLSKVYLIPHEPSGFKNPTTYPTSSHSSPSVYLNMLSRIEIYLTVPFSTFLLAI